MHEIMRKRLEWVARNPKGEMFPEMFSPDSGVDQNWTEHLAAATAAALDEIDAQNMAISSLRTTIVEMKAEIERLSVMAGETAHFLLRSREIVHQRAKRK